MGSFTKFQTVYNIKNRIIYIKSHRNLKLRYLNFNSFDFSCQSVSKVLDLNADLSGDITDQFNDYSIEMNEALVIQVWASLGITNVLPAALYCISRYSETLICNATSVCTENSDSQISKVNLLQIISIHSIFKQLSAAD